MPKSKHGRGYALLMPTPNPPSDIFASQIVDEVHAKDSYIFLQLWALGRASDVELLKAEDPNFDFVGASAIPISPSHQTPRPLTVDEIKSYVQWYADAADKAINQAGFDGVELHFANGYLPDQFLQDTSNQRTDEYGGSVENRARFPLEIIEAVSKAVGEDRVGFRISPWSPFQGMRMEDPKPTFAHLVSQAKERFPDLAYLHVVDDRVSGDGDLESSERVSKEFLRQIWGEKAFIAAGGYTPETAAETVKAKGGLVAFGRHYIANVSSLLPTDLPRLFQVLTSA
jgi:NADPH2 dehydrogenase